MDQLRSVKCRGWEQDQPRCRPKGLGWDVPVPRPVLLGVTQPRCSQVDIHIMTQPPSGEWVYFDTEISNSSGRISYVIPEERRLGIGVYPVKMVVR